MHQSFEPPPGHGGDIHSVWVWKPVKFLNTEAKILSEVPAPWYSAVHTKVPCVESAVTAFLKSSHQTLSISKRRQRGSLRKQPPRINVAASYTNILSNVQITKRWESATTDESNVNPPRWMLVKRAFTSPPRETQAFPPPYPGWVGGVSNDWCITRSIYNNKRKKYCGCCISREF